MTPAEVLAEVLTEHARVNTDRYGVTTCACTFQTARLDGHRLHVAERLAACMERVETVEDLLAGGFVFRLVSRESETP